MIPDVHKEYWNLYAKIFTQNIQGESLLNQLVTNPAVTGDFAESFVRHIAKMSLPMYRISTGCIIVPSDLTNKNKKQVPQCDSIIWDPTRLPALFEFGDFALVPSVSVKGVLEIKRTLKSEDDAREQMRKIQARMPSWSRDYILGVVIRHNKSLHHMPVSDRWISEFLDRKKDSERPPLTRILDNKGNVDMDGLFVFLYFFSQLVDAGKNGRGLGLHKDL